MQVEHVVSILESLANGVDPITDTALPERPFLSPDVIRALFTAASMLQEHAPAADALPRARPRSAGARWNDEEDAQLCEKYDSGVPLRDLAATHGRSAGAITARLVKLGKLDPATLGPRLRERVTGPAATLSP